jgi:hypothetical protein
MTPSHEIVQTPPPPKPEGTLWFALLAAPLTWSAAEIIAVTVVGRSCGSGARPAEWQLILLTGVFTAAAIVAAISAVLAFRLFKQYSREARIATFTRSSRAGFIAQLAFFVSLLLFFNIVLFGLAPLVVDPCLGG